MSLQLLINKSEKQRQVLFSAYLVFYLNRSSFCFFILLAWLQHELTLKQDLGNLHLLVLSSRTLKAGQLLTLTFELVTSAIGVLGGKRISQQGAIKFETT